MIISNPSNKLLKWSTDVHFLECVLEEIFEPVGVAGIQFFHIARRELFVVEEFPFKEFFTKFALDEVEQLKIASGELIILSDIATGNRGQFMGAPRLGSEGAHIS